MNEAQGIAMTCAQIQLPSDASEIASSSNWVLGPVLGSAGIGLSPGYSVAIACAWAHSAPLMGIPNLLPFPIHPNFRLSLTWTHSLLQRRPKKAASPPRPSFPPKTPPIQSTKPAPKIPVRPSRVTGQVLPPEQVLCFSLHKSNSFSTAWREVCWLLAKFHYIHFYI